VKILKVKYPVVVAFMVMFLSGINHALPSTSSPIHFDKTNTSYSHELKAAVEKSWQAGSLINSEINKNLKRTLPPVVGILKWRISANHIFADQTSLSGENKNRTVYWLLSIFKI